MKQFIPFDDAWFEHPGSMPGPLVPYRCGVPCRHELARDDARQCTGPMSPSTFSASPTFAPMAAMVPPGSSST